MSDKDHEDNNGNGETDEFKNIKDRGLKLGSGNPPRLSTPYPEGYKYHLQFFPELEVNKEAGSRRSSIPAHPDNLNSNIYDGRRHSEVILSPSDAFRRDYFKFSSNPFSKVNEYISDVFQKFHKRFRSQDEVIDKKSNLKLDYPPVIPKWKLENMSNDDNYLKTYLNPLETSDNGNEQLTYHSDDFFEGDEEIGRPNSHSTPKHSPDNLVHDTLFLMSESGRSSRRNSDDGDTKLEQAKDKIQNQESVMAGRTEMILNASSLQGSPTGAGKMTPEKSILRNQSSNPTSPKRMRRRSVDFKMQSTHSDETLNRYSNNLQDDRQSSHGHYEDNLRTVMFFHPHLTHPRWDHANVNGTHHPDRRFSRMTVHPLMPTIPRDAFGPRLSTVVDEVMTSKTPMNEDEDSLIKLSEIEYASGGLLSFNEDHSTNVAHCPPDTETLLFKDGRRRIDMVLVYEEEDFGVMTEAETLRRERRKIFRENLEKEGLEFEVEDKKTSFDEKTFFLKIHAPWQVMTRYAELMNIKMPIKKLKPLLNTDRIFTDDEIKLEELESGLVVEKSNPKIFSCLAAQTDDKPSYEKTEKKKSIFGDMFEYDHSKIAEEPSFYKATFSRDQEEQFVVKDRETFFTSAQRSQIVWQILMRAKYDDSEKVGIRRLLNDYTFLAAFPLHEGSYDKDAPNGFHFDRRLLYLEWARPSKWFKKQPLWLIRKYFGDKIGLYFAWLGFYTYMLFPPAIVGVLCFLYGLGSLESDDNIPSKEICDEKGVGNITLCPMCDKACRYMKLGDSCMYAKITYLFDNPATVFFAIFMSFWATTYLELWKRQQSVIIWEWDLQFIEEDEEPRPEFEASVKTFRINPVTKEKEPYLSTWSRALRFFATGSTVLFMIVVVLGAVLGTIIYRISLVTIIYREGGEYIRDHAKIFTSMTAALMNLIIIMILTRFYHSLALWLTNIENPRTQTEYEDSFTFKIFVFEFVNFYSSLIYIAFFKGRFFMHPGDKDARESEFLKVKNDICDPAGCLSELCIQLAIIMVGKQCLNNILELLYPKFWNWWYHRIHHNNTKKDFKRKLTRWEEDYQMQDAGRLALFEEYLEMVLQYGFVTLFVAAFPLAPLFALLNNIIEIRLDAYKMVTQSRRPLAERVEDIGAWYGILKGLTYTAVVSNAFVIAYTSDFIPRMVYKFVYSDTHDLRGYIESSLSAFNVSDYTKDMGSPENDPDPEVCYYRGYRNGSKDDYGLSPQYWHVFAARLAFVVVFEHIVFALTGVMAYIIPDVPAAVKTQMQRERLLAKEARYERGLRSAGNPDDELLAAIRDQNHSRLDDILRRGSWGRRLSKHSDSLDAHVDVASKSRKMSSSTAWEVS